jgi:hypothetical protein
MTRLEDRPVLLKEGDLCAASHNLSAGKVSRPAHTFAVGQNRQLISSESASRFPKEQAAHLRCLETCGISSTTLYG